MERVYIDGWYLDQKAHQLQKQDSTIQLPLKSSALLSILVKANGKIVSREELLAALWPTTVVSDDSLTKQISDTRQLLKQYNLDKVIETVPKQGYRLKAESVVFKGETPSSKHTDKKSSVWQSPRAVTSLFVLLLIVVGFFSFYSDTQKEQKLAILPFQLKGLSEDIGEKFNNEIHHQSTQLVGLDVLPKSQVANFESSRDSITDLVSQLGVQYWLEGEIEQDSDLFVLTAQLVEQGKVHFSQKFEGKVDKIARDAERIAQIISLNVAYTLQDEVSVTASSSAQGMLNQRCGNYIDLAQLYVDFILVNIEKIEQQGEQACLNALVSNSGNNQAKFNLSLWYLKLAKAHLRDDERKTGFLELSQKYASELKSVDHNLFTRLYVDASTINVRAPKISLQQVYQLIDENDKYIQSLKQESLTSEATAAIYNSFGVLSRYGAVYALRFNENPAHYFERSEQAFLRSIDESPSHPYAHANYARLMKTRASYEIQKQADPRDFLRKAISLYQKTMELEGETAHTYNNMANVYSTLTKWLAQHKLDYQESLKYTLELYQRAIDWSKSNYYVYNNLSDLYSGLAFYGASSAIELDNYIALGLEASEQALTIKTDYDWPLFNQGKLHTFESRFELSQNQFNTTTYRACKASFERALLRRPSYAMGYVYSANCEYLHTLFLLESGEHSAAWKSLERIQELLQSGLAINDKQASAYVLLSKSYLTQYALDPNMQSVEKAEYFIQQAIDLAPEDKSLKLPYLLVLSALEQLAPPQNKMTTALDTPNAKSFVSEYQSALFNRLLEGDVLTQKFTILQDKTDAQLQLRSQNELSFTDTITFNLMAKEKNAWLVQQP